MGVQVDRKYKTKLIFHGYSISKYWNIVYPHHIYSPLSKLDQATMNKAERQEDFIPWGPTVPVEKIKMKVV